MIMFRKFWGSWPQHYGRLDSGDVVYIRIRHGEIWIGVGSDEDKAYENSELVKDDVAEYCGVSGALEALTELQKRGYYFVPPNKEDK
jgi:hypothetical protein